MFFLPSSLSLSLFFKMFGVFAVRVEMDLRRGVDG